MSGSLRATARFCRAQHARYFHYTSRFNATENFVMPALSPTMTEGNIATWKVKEGKMPIYLYD